MNLPYIQSELFHELVSMETLLKPEYRTEIKKSVDNVMHFSLEAFTKHPSETHPRWCCIYSKVLYPRYIKKANQITAEINRIWDAIPAECKRDDILK